MILRWLLNSTRLQKVPVKQDEYRNSKEVVDQSCYVQNSDSNLRFHYNLPSHKQN